MRTVDYSGCLSLMHLVLYKVPCALLLPTYAASATGRVHRGDKIVSINGVNLKDKTQEDVVSHVALQAHMGYVHENA